MPKIRIFYYSAVIDLGKKSNLRLWRQITVGNLKGSSWGQWGSIGNKKWVKTVKKLPCLKIRIFYYAAVINLAKKKTNWRLWRQFTVGTPRGSILGPMGPIGAKKWVKKVKNYHAPNLEFLTTTSIWAKNGIYGNGAKSRWGPPRVHLGTNGVPLGPKKMGQNRSNFLLLRGHRFGKKILLMVVEPNHGGDPLGSILGPMGSHWGQNRGQNRQKLPCPKIRIFDYSVVIDLGKKSN